MSENKSVHLSREEDGDKARLGQYLTALNQAKNEYDVAQSCFAEATDPEIIDGAIYLMKAARAKYSFFLKQVRRLTGTPS